MAYRDKEMVKIKSKEWRDKNPERVVAYRLAHQEERNEASKKHHRNNRESKIKYAREYRKKNKLAVIRHYSKGELKCKRCGFDNMSALQIDHIDGGGEKHRRSIRGDIYVWLIKNNFPDGFQVLCANCQIIKFRVEGK